MKSDLFLQYLKKTSRYHNMKLNEATMSPQNVEYDEDDIDTNPNTILPPPPQYSAASYNPTVPPLPDDDDDNDDIYENKKSGKRKRLKKITQKDIMDTRETKELYKTMSDIESIKPTPTAQEDSEANPNEPTIAGDKLVQNDDILFRQKTNALKITSDVPEPDTIDDGNEYTDQDETQYDYNENPDPNDMGGDPNAMGGDPNAMGGDPNAMGGDPNAMGGDPNAMGGDPNAMGGDPNAMGGDPNAMGGDPNAMGGVPNAKGGDPNAMGGDPNAMGGDPNAMGGVPNATGGDPNAMGGDPNAMGGDPNAMGGDPNAMGADPNAMGGDPNAMGGVPPVPAAPVPGVPEKLDPIYLGKVMMLKKINARLISSKKLLSSYSDPKYNELKAILYESIDVFRNIINNFDQFKERLDEIVVGFQNFLDVFVKKFDKLSNK
jgi:hypothetical protein